ncbi:MAG: DsbA family protein [Angustibacter sp.]
MTSGKSSREAREAKAAERRLAAQRAESRRRNGIRAGIAVVVLVAIVGFGALIQAQRGGTGDSTANPANTSGPANGVITVGQSSAPVELKVYEDFQCPYCKQFEESSNDLITSYVQAGKVQVKYHPMAFLDEASSTRYSTRALNAAGCVVDSTPSAFEKFHDLLYANQPAEKSAGLPDAQLVDYAKQVGAGDISSCVKDLRFEGWTKRVTDQASKDGVVSTPTVFVDGKQIQNVLDPTAVKTAIEAALAK